MPKVGANKSESKPADVDYVGCWSGMRGGRVRITSRRITDLNVDETYSYKELSTRRDEKSMGVLLEVGSELRRGFLGKFVLVHFGTNEIRAIKSYRTYGDYQKDKFKGFGFFEKVDCVRFEK